MYFGKPIPEWIIEHRNDTITLGEISDACEKAQASCLRLAERVLKVGRNQDLAAYAWFMQEYLNEKKALDLALDILGERYGYPDDVPEEDTAHDDDPDDDHIDEDIQAAEMAAEDMPDNEDIPFC